MKTKAAILEKISHPLALWEMTIPSLLPGQVLVKMAFSGICRTQINEILGFKGEDHYLPHTLGHEGSGIVVDVGPNVDKVKVGDPVVVSWIKGKGKDIPSTKYFAGSVQVNSGAVSTFLEYAVISENRLVVLPKEIELREAALLGCAFSTGAGTVWNEMEIQPEQSIAIFGLGGIGMSALIAAVIAKAYPIIAVDIHEEKLQKAKSLGATHLIDAKKESFLSHIQHATQGKMVDFSFESAGINSAMESAFQAVKPKTGKCFIAGNLENGKKIQINPFDLILGKKIYGTWGGKTDPDEDIPKYCKLIKEQRLLLSPLISHEVPLDNINELITLFQENKVQRGLIAFI